MLAQLPPHLVSAVLVAGDPNLVEWLGTPHPTLHRLALETLFPSLRQSSQPAIHMHPDSFRFPPSQHTLEAILSCTVAYTALRDFDCSLVQDTDQRFSDTLQQSFINALQSLKHLSALSVKWGMCTPTVVEAIAGNIISMSALQALTLSADPWFKAPGLAGALRECPGLTKLHLRAVYVQGGRVQTGSCPEATTDFDPMLSTLQRLISLQSLELSYRAVTTQMLQPLEKILLEPSSADAAALQHFLPSLTHLDFEGLSCVGQGLMAFSGLMTVLKPRLKNLNISWNLQQTGERISPEVRNAQMVVSLLSMQSKCLRKALMDSQVGRSI